jgi:hypothetical protein
MSWYRKIKSIYSISLVTISFIIWSTLSKLLFESPVEYKLFLITLSIVFFVQYLSSKELKNTIVIMVPLGLSILASFIFFKGQIILINTIFLLFMILITYSMDKSSIEYSKYKEDINKSMIVLLLIWIVSFILGNEFVNAMYKFHILYIIMIIMLMRETRRYVYDVKGNNSMVTNVIITVSVLTLSLDYASKIVGEFLSLLMKLASFILIIIITILTKIFGGPLGAISNKLKELIIKRKLFNMGEGVIDKKLTEQPILTEYKGIQIPPVVILAFKIIILLVILYIIYKFISRFKVEKKVYNGFVEEKERIVRKKSKKHWARDLFGKVFEGGGSNREKILSTYKGFEKITDEVDIYKPYMTATQLKNVTKIKVDNFDNLEEMTQVYNEAKFSLHDMTQMQLDQVKKGHNNIKKQL